MFEGLMAYKIQKAKRSTKKEWKAEKNGLLSLFFFVEIWTSSVEYYNEKEKQWERKINEKIIA